MEETPNSEVDTSNPRLQAIMDLLKFLSKSESDRAMPPKPAAMPPKMGEPDGAEQPSDDELEALKSLVG